MDYCFSHFDVGFWTAACESHAYNILGKYLSLDQWIKVKFIYSSNRCLTKFSLHFGLSSRTITIKPLRKIWKTQMAKSNGWNRYNTLIIENTPQTCLQNYGNAIYVNTYYGSDEDDTLFRLIEYLETFLDCKNVRRYDKRDWLLQF